MTYEYPPGGGDIETTTSPTVDTESKPDQGIQQSTITPTPQLHLPRANLPPVFTKRQTKVRLNSVAEESSHSQPSDYRSSSLSTISSVSESSDIPQEPFVSASPEAHLSKLKSIHRKVKRRKRLRRLRRIVHFIITKILVLLLLKTSLILLLCGYFLSIRYLLVSGCIILIAAVGFQVQLCFTERTGPNKFNPMSVPFSIPAEDLKQIETEPVKEMSPAPPNGVNTEQVNTAQLEIPDAPRTPMSFSDLQAKRLSLALVRVANNALQVPRYQDGDSSGVLRLARRLTLASSAIGIGSHEPVMGGSSWLTGSQIRHGVRRSLAWNATGASRFYEQNYD